MIRPSILPFNSPRCSVRRCALRWVAFRVWPVLIGPVLIWVILIWGNQELHAGQRPQHTPKAAESDSPQPQASQHSHWLNTKQQSRRAESSHFEPGDLELGDLELDQETLSRLFPQIASQVTHQGSPPWRAPAKEATFGLLGLDDDWLPQDSAHSQRIVADRGLVASSTEVWSPISRMETALRFFWATIGVTVLLIVGTLMSGQVLSWLVLRRLQRDPHGVAKTISGNTRLLYHGVLKLATLGYDLSLPMLVLSALVAPLTVAFWVSTTEASALTSRSLAGWLATGTVALLCIPVAIQGIRTALLRLTDEDPGLPLSEDQAPRLWRMMREVAGRVGVRPVEEIWLSCAAEVTIEERGSYHRWRSSHRRVLILGVAGLTGLRLEALEGLLICQFARLRSDTSGGGHWAQRVEHIMQAGDRSASLLPADAQLLSSNQGLTAEAADHTGSVNSDGLRETFLAKIKRFGLGVFREGWLSIAGGFAVVDCVLRAYRAAFAQAALGAARLHELWADRLAVQLCSAEVLQQGLRHLIRQRVEFQTRLEQADQAAQDNLYQPESRPDIVEHQDIELQADRLWNHPQTDIGRHRRLGLVAPVHRQALWATWPSPPPRGSLTPAWELLPNREDLTQRIHHLLQRTAPTAQGNQPCQVESQQPANAHRLAQLMNEGRSLLAAGCPQEACDRFNKVLQETPRFAAAYHGRALAQESACNYPAALADWNRAVELDPWLADAHAGLAWLLAASPDPSLLDGERAVEHALEACALGGWHDPTRLEALAAAHAAAGDFDRAVELTQQALDQLGSNSADPRLSVEDLQKRRDAYRRNQSNRRPSRVSA